LRGRFVWLGEPDGLPLPSNPLATFATIQRVRTDRPRGGVTLLAGSFGPSYCWSPPMPASTADRQPALGVAAPDDLIPATLLCAELRSLTGDAGPGHRKLVQLAADGRVSPPLERRNGRWGCPRAKLPELAAALGLQPKAPPTPAPRARRALAPTAQPQHAAA
jgi:hypothetical protein